MVMGSVPVVSVCPSHAARAVLLAADPAGAVRPTTGST